ncbi:alpha/beta fold hydrolase [Alkaliphilus peptidifermentans]|uniref:Pimeloyl-ACP methyl ester carboxylesterase n=1 Tax=Alkaliphilus peptidifermentans DSM 18978 TaxID=1120976 RepID=A0A1G5GUP1_9FIRM|nr:alpha/beta hydrolase [Alkaliphilus peptidifermentans]SCY55069.1 Pimeloyl-ACP methyl ester carboxylesterase [Alkaliphilus peptidifermentans DSM 18978]
MKLIKKCIKITLVLLIICILFVLFLPSRTPHIEGNNSVASIQKIQLGGLEQFIMIRGKDTNNPILLFLHGGPGYSQISFARKYQEELEENFIVVNWDQRGSGMSYSHNIPRKSMNRSRFREDTKELIDYLCMKYEKENVYLAGHSWGSELGLHVIDKYPERVAAFISIGQVVNKLENEAVSYDFVLEMAKKNNNKRALEDLLRIGRPPYKNTVSDTLTQRKWLDKYGGVERNVNTLNDIILGSIFSPEYTGIDGIKFALGSKFSADTMWGHNLDLDFVRDLPEVRVPVYFFAGRHDYNTPSTLIEQYYNKIIAPHKELIWFEESAHFPHFEEPEKFAQLAIRIKENVEKKQ